MRNAVSHASMQTSSSDHAVQFPSLLLWKGFGGVTHRKLLEPEFGRFKSDKAYILDRKWTPKMDSFRAARRATLPCGCNLVCGFFRIISNRESFITSIDQETSEDHRNKKMSRKRGRRLVIDWRKWMQTLQQRLSGSVYREWMERGETKIPCELCPRPILTAELPNRTQRSAWA